MHDEGLGLLWPPQTAPEVVREGEVWVDAAAHHRVVNGLIGGLDAA